MKTDEHHLSAEALHIKQALGTSSSSRGAWSAIKTLVIKQASL